MNIEKISLGFAAFLFCGGSIYCSIILWVGEQETLSMQWLAGSIVLAMEICKFAFFPIASNRSGVFKYLLRFIASLLLIFSVMATVAFFESGTANSNSQLRTTSYTYQTIQKAIQSYENEIASIEQVQKNYADKKNFGAKAAQQSKRLDELRDFKEQALQELNNVSLVETRGINAIFMNTASLLNLTIDTMRLIVYTVIAVTVDICGIICLLLLVTPNKKHYNTALNNVTENVTDNTTHDVTGNVTVTTDEYQPVTDSGNVEQHAEIIQRIIDGEYGEYPALRTVRKKEKIGYPNVSKIFEALVEEGKLFKHKNRFQLSNAL